MSSDSVPLTSLEQSISFIDVKHSLVVNTNNIGGTELLSTKAMSLITSPSFIHLSVYSYHLSEQLLPRPFSFYLILHINIGSSYNQWMYQPNEFKLE